MRWWPADLSARVRQTVQSHVPGDDREQRSRATILERLEHLERPFDEEGGPCHVTGSAVVVGARGTVLHIHKRLHKWLQPGGHVNPGEAPWQAARREGHEETGLVLRHPGEGARLIHVDVHAAAGGHEHLDLRYLLVAEDAEPRPGAGESPHVRWFSWDEAAAEADLALQGALAAARLQPEAAGAQHQRAGR